MISYLTYDQEEYFNNFIKRIEKKEVCFRDAERRAWGKTIIINELGLHLQALGYEVYIITPANNEYYVSKRISNVNDLRGIKRDNLVILVDEEFRESDLLINVEEFCDHYNVPMVGFVRY